jgi:hypothetical protein
MEAAILREKQLKHWNRGWKLKLIEERNPHWDDLAVTVLGMATLPPSSSPRKRGSTDAAHQRGGQPSMDPRLRGDDKEVS